MADSRTVARWPVCFWRLNIQSEDHAETSIGAGIQPSRLTMKAKAAQV